jgi:capsular exopolysaccharide synthesis family protein
VRAPEESESGLRRLIDVVRRRWLLILFHVVLAAGIGIGLSQLGQDEYEASSTLLFRQSNLSAAIFGNDFFERQEDPLVQASTNVGLVSQPVVSTRVSAALDGALSPSDLQDMVTASQDGDSDLVTVTATSPDPREAQSVANAWAEEFVGFRREADQRQITEAIGLVQTELQATRDRGDDTTELRQLLAQLKVLQPLQTGNVEFIQPAALPSSPTGASTMTIGLAAGLAGLLLGIGAAFVVDRLDRRFASPEELSDALQLPVLGEIPRVRDIEFVPGRDKTPPELHEAYQLLTVRLGFFDVDHKAQVIVIASAAPGEGKTTTAIHVARAMAIAGSRVLLLDGDLRKGDLGLRLGVGGGAGLTDVLTGKSRLDGAVRRIELAGGPEAGANGAKAPGKAFLDILPRGKQPPNPLQLLRSDRFAGLLAQAREHYDSVIVDTPPLLAIGDALQLGAVADGCVIVSRVGQSTTSDARRLQETLAEVDIPVLGLVVNGVSGRRVYSYAYGKSGGAAS